MRKFLYTLAGLLICSAAYAAALEQYSPGFALQDGNKLNKMVDQVNSLTSSTSNDVSGVAADYKLARGETALDGSNPTPVATGLATIVSCTVLIKLGTAPGVGTSVITYGTSSGTLNLYGWKVTTSSDTTLIASTGTETVGWVCVGT
jgi:hypothetical protein